MDAPPSLGYRGFSAARGAMITLTKAQMEGLDRPTEVAFCESILSTWEDLRTARYPWMAPALRAADRAVVRSARGLCLQRDIQEMDRAAVLAIAMLRARLLGAGEAFIADMAMFYLDHAELGEATDAQLWIEIQLEDLAEGTLP